jgi:hypothetical protein
MQEPLSLPLVAPLPPICITQSVQNLHIEITSTTLCGRYGFMTHQAVHVKEFREHFDCPLYINEMGRSLI